MPIISVIPPTFLISDRKKFGRNPKSDRDWKDRKKIEIYKKKDGETEKRLKDKTKIERLKKDRKTEKRSKDRKTKKRTEDKK